MWAVLPGLASPGAAQILDFDAARHGIQLATQGEELSAALRVQQGIGHQLAGDHHRVVRSGATRQVACHLAAGPANLVKLSRRVNITLQVIPLSQWFEALRADALPKGASRDLISKIAEERWTA